MTNNNNKLYINLYHDKNFNYKFKYIYYYFEFYWGVLNYI